MAKNIPSANGTMLDFEETKTTKEPDALQHKQAIIDVLNDGWVLYRDNATFKWHIRRKGLPPYSLETKTFLTRTMVAMLQFNLIVKDDSKTNKVETQFILK